MFRRLHALHLVLGAIIWSGWFVLMYISLSVVCSLMPPATSQGAMTWINGKLLLLTLLVFLWLLVFGYHSWQNATTSISANQRFIGQVSAGVYLLFAVAVLMIGMPVIILPPCV